MVASVNTNVNALAAVQALGDISNQLTQTQSAIESGYKVSTASDNPAVFTIAQGLRANVDALSAVSDSLSSGIATLQAQTQGATSISNTLNTLLQTVTQGVNTTDPTQLAAINGTIKNALNNIDAYAAATTVNGVNLLNTAGSFNVLSNVSGSSVNVSTAAASTSTGLGLTGLQLTAAGTTLTPGAAAPASGDTIKVTNGSSSITFEFSDGSGPLTTTPTANNTVVAVMLGTTPTSSTAMGSLLSAMQAHGVSASEDSNGVVTVAAGTVAAAGSGSITTATTASNGTAAIATVNAAIKQIGTTLSTLGSSTLELQGLSDYTGQLSSSVQTGLGALVDANLSDESAQLASLQTKQSLAIQSLTIANQAPSALLQLFR